MASPGLLELVAHPLMVGLQLLVLLLEVGLHLPALSHGVVEVVLLEGTVHTRGRSLEDTLQHGILSLHRHQLRLLLVAVAADTDESRSIDG